MIHDYERLLTTYAYNILGSYEDARDAVQDAYLNYMQQQKQVENEKAYLVRSVINIAINKKQQQQRERSAYTGAWLPEPIATEHADSMVNSKDILSYSLMVLLEQLNAKQRAVFILKEAFAYDHAAIAAALDITEDHSRKLLSRAREQLKQAGVTTTQPADAAAYVNRYLAAIQQADMPQLEKMLHDDITVVSDGGGKVAAFRNTITGREDVIKLLAGIHQKFYHNIVLKVAVINHEPALCYYDSGKLVNCQVFAMQDNGVANIYFVRNPDKLQALEKSLQ